MTLDEILENSHDMKTKWTNFVAFPYSRAYAAALKEFNNLRKAQDKAYAQKSDLGILALSICSGGILTQVFAQTAWKAVAAKKSLDIICNNNWEKAFKIADFVSNNKAANFIVGALWETGAKLLDDKTKELFEQNSSNFPSAQQWQTETDAITSLMGFVDDCFTKFRDTARGIFKSTALDDSQRKDAVKKLLGSKFANPPAKAIVNEAGVSAEIELLFLLQVVMDLDYAQEFHYSAKTDRDVVVRKNYIDAPPDSKNYPVERITQTSRGYSGQSIGYDDLGSLLYEKINKLHKKMFNTELLKSRLWSEVWSSTIDKNAFNAAHGAILALEQKGLSRVKQSLIE